VRAGCRARIVQIIRQCDLTCCEAAEWGRVSDGPIYSAAMSPAASASSNASPDVRRLGQPPSVGRDRVSPGPCGTPKFNHLRTPKLSHPAKAQCDRRRGEVARRRGGCGFVEPPAFALKAKHVGLWLGCESSLIVRVNSFVFSPAGDQTGSERWCRCWSRRKSQNSVLRTNLRSALPAALNSYRFRFRTAEFPALTAHLTNSSFRCCRRSEEVSCSARRTVHRVA
jgi:hypothetical protein